MSDDFEYRLSWEIGSAAEPDAIRIIRGPTPDAPDVWRRLSPEQWDALIWRPASRVDREPSQQYNTLRSWEVDHYQPIRNVRLERRPARADDEGWEPISEPSTTPSAPVLLEVREPEEMSLDEISVLATDIAQAIYPSAGPLLPYLDAVTAIEVVLLKRRAALSNQGAREPVRCTCGPPQMAYDDHEASCPLASVGAREETLGGRRFTEMDVETAFKAGLTSFLADNKLIPIEADEKLLTMATQSAWAKYRAALLDPKGQGGKPEGDRVKT